WVRFRVDGKHVRRSAHTSRKAEAQAFLARLLEEARASNVEGNRTYDDARDRFFAEVRLKPRTRQTYLSNDRACQTVFAGRRLTEIDRRTLADHIGARKRAGVSDATIRRDLAFLSSLLGMAVRWGWLEANPITRMDKRGLREARPRTRFLTPAEFRRLVAAAPLYLKPILTLAVETSMRRAELLGLTVQSIDLERREIHLDKTKTNAPRRVPLTDTAMVTVEGLLNAPNRPRSPYLLCRPDGRRYTDLKRAFSSSLKASKISDF